MIEGWRVDDDPAEGTSAADLSANVFAGQHDTERKTELVPAPPRELKRKPLHARRKISTPKALSRRLRGTPSVGDDTDSSVPEELVGSVDLSAERTPIDEPILKFGAEPSTTGEWYSTVDPSAPVPEVMTFENDSPTVPAGNMLPLAHEPTPPKKSQHQAPETLSSMSTVVRAEVRRRSQRATSSGRGASKPRGCTVERSVPEPKFQTIIAKYGKEIPGASVARQRKVLDRMVDEALHTVESNEKQSIVKAGTSTANHQRVLEPRVPDKAHGPGIRSHMDKPNQPRSLQPSSGLGMLQLLDGCVADFLVRDVPRKAIVPHLYRRRRPKH